MRNSYVVVDGKGSPTTRLSPSSSPAAAAVRRSEARASDVRVGDGVGVGVGEQKPATSNGRVSRERSSRTAERSERVRRRRRRSEERIARAEDVERGRDRSSSSSSSSTDGEAAAAAVVVVVGERAGSSSSSPSGDESSDERRRINGKGSVSRSTSSPTRRKRSCGNDSSSSVPAAGDGRNKKVCVKRQSSVDAKIHLNSHDGRRARSSDKRRRTIDVKKRLVVLQLLGRHRVGNGKQAKSGGDARSDAEVSCSACCCCCCCCCGPFSSARRRHQLPAPAPKMHPTLLTILVTALLTLASTVLLNVAILTDRWEVVTFDAAMIESILAARNVSAATRLTWLFDGRAGVFILNPSPSSASTLKTSSSLSTTTTTTSRTMSGGMTVADDSTATVTPSSAAAENASISNRDIATSTSPRPTSFDPRLLDGELSDSYFVPMHGGVWKMCPDLSESELQYMMKLGYGLDHCVYNLDPAMMQKTNTRDDWVQRMQNLSISCAMVCLIILGASAVVGFVGVCKQEIPAVLVTGVLYLLTSTFGVFALTIMHFKRRTKKDYGIIDQYLSSAFYPARSFDSGWSYHVGWTGVGLCFMASILWLVLARVMRLHILQASLS